jgi:hypothetical protein
MTLTVELLGTATTSGKIFLHPQPTPGGSPEFFQLVQIKSGKTISYVYKGNFDLSGKPAGNYVGCVASIDEASIRSGQFSPDCVSFVVRNK